MSVQNQPPLYKNRITPPYLKSILVLILFLSSIIFLPSAIASSSQSNSDQFPSFKVREELPLYQEKLDVIVGKEESIISKLELDGGTVETPFDLSLPVFASVTQIDFIVSNQSNFDRVWTNPLWKNPDGLVVRIKVKTLTQAGLESISSYVNSLIFQFYGVNLSIYNLIQVSPSESLLSLVASTTTIDYLAIFHEVFAPYEENGNGNMVKIIAEKLQQSPTIFAFGYSIHAHRGNVRKIVRSSIVAYENGIIFEDDLRTFNISSSLNERIIPNPSAWISKLSFRLPFYANITKVSPDPDNVAGIATGFFEWILKYFTTTQYPVFDTEVSYYPFSPYNVNYPRIIVTNSYSDQLLEEDGILNMTYTVQNIGSAAAYDTVVRFPIPTELLHFIIAGMEIPVLRKELQIDELYSSFIELEINYFATTYTIPILDFNGWYFNTTSFSLAHWMDNTSIELNKYITILCSNGVSSDLYNAVEARISPYLALGMPYIITHEQEIRDELALAVTEAYSTVFSAFYKNQTLFQYNSSDFTYVQGLYGGYLECVVPLLDVNETTEKSWTITDIPTSNDKFGAFSISLNQIGLDEYAVFTTTESDYKTLMLSIFTEIDSAGRFLSVYDSNSESFISLGSRFSYSDIKGNEYYGLTNGLNFQMGDDEAVLQSVLYSEESVYTVGDQVTFTLNISNYGTLDAYDIHVDIVNVKLNYLWFPTDVIIVKSFDIDQIAIGENLTYGFSMLANSYIGLNTYMAIISFISDKGQGSVDVEDPWTGTTAPWIYGGEALNILSSTLTFGILLPPDSLKNLSRPSFPLPEIKIETSYQLSEDNTSITIEYKISNEGLSPTIISVYQFIDQTQYTLSDGLSRYIHDSEVLTLSPVITTQQMLTKISFANITLNPSERLEITVHYADLPTSFNIPPIIIDYYSLYEIFTTDFQPVDPQSQNQLPESSVLEINLAPANVTEGSQTLFLWSSFTHILTINIPISEPYERITVSSLPWLYVVISTAVLAGVIVTLMVSSRMKNR